MKEVNLIKISKLKQILITLSFFAWIASSIFALVTVIVLLVGAITIVLVIAGSSIAIALTVLASLSATTVIVLVRLTITFRWITILLGIVACLSLSSIHVIFVSGGVFGIIILR
jgi:cellulose synthase/poly-beta-1,6-N-acetylglucosamine synthase-like glycosyltransferase